MKFRIGTKISLLTCTMVLLASWFLAERVMRYCAFHVVDHEVVDLVDETNLSAQRILRNTDEVREDLSDRSEIIRLGGFEELLESLEAGREIDSLPPNLRDLLVGLMIRHRDFLQVEIRTWNEAEDPGLSQTVARLSRRIVRSVDTPVGQEDFLRSLALAPALQGQLSKFTQANVTYRTLDELKEADPEYADELATEEFDTVPVDGRKLILQAGAVIRGPVEATPEAPAEPGFLLFVTAHFSELDSDLSNDEQTTPSPRHILYLVDQDRRFLQHPDPLRIADLTKRWEDEPEKSLLQADPTVQSCLMELEQLMEKAADSPDIRTEQELGHTVRDKELQSMQAWFGFTRGLGVSSRIVSIFDPEPHDVNLESKRVLRKKLLDRLNGYLIRHPQYKVSLPSRDIRRFKIRSDSANRQDLHVLEREIASQLREAGINESLAWESPVRLESFALHFIRLAYEPNHRDRFLDMVVAVSYQEIASDVEAEMFWIRVGAIACSLGAGVLAVLFSQIITRPLNKIIASTQRLANGEFELALPVNDRGEVGELARSFQVMVEHLRERSRALQEEQKKIRGLNEDLKRERDLLDIRVQQRTGELTRANADLESARDAALEASRAKSAFLAQMSHELRTPLNAIIGYGELLVEEITDSPAETHIPDLKKIIDSGRHLLGLINDILDLSKVEAGKMELFFDTFEVKPLLESVVGTVEPMVRKNENRLRWSCADEVTVIRADRTRVRQILLNLLSNSAKFTDHGEIELTAAIESASGENFIVFRVRDTGVGMTPEQMQRLFQNFSQADASTTRKFGGTGLGLAICKRFCEMMGGEIFVESTFQQGSTFTVRLPVNGRALAESAADVAARTTGSTHSGPPRLTVLVIDDDPDARELLQRQFEREGFLAVTASSGEEGLRLAQQVHPAVIALDVVMPGMNGWDFLTALKSDGRLQEVPVILIVTTKDLTTPERQLLDGSQHLVLQKGTYTREQLVDHVRNLIKKEK
ncbi:MAG: response regulator [Planctomycetes bacterium]|nr:response regulator [Planctomycetota bacterium]